jgi:uncharacterized membrane protein
MVAVVQMMCLVYILLPTFKWMIFPNLGVAVVGLWGAFAFSARLTLAVRPPSVVPPLLE